MAEFEKQLSEEHEFCDQQWADVNAVAEEAVAKVNAEIVRILTEQGKSKQFMPRTLLSWQPRGDNMTPRRRAE